MSDKNSDRLKELASRLNEHVCSFVEPNFLERLFGSKLNLSDQEFAAVSSSTPSIPAATEARFKFTDYMERQFTKMVTS